MLFMGEKSCLRKDSQIKRAVLLVQLGFSLTDTVRVSGYFTFCQNQVR
jgi:hypothetical protein